MVTQHLVVVHFVDVVTGQNKHVVGIEFVDKFDVLVNGVCRTLVPLAFLFAHVGRQDEHSAVVAVKVPRLSVADVSIEFQRLVLGKDTYCVYARLRAVGQRKVNDTVLAAVGHGRLGDVARKYPQTASLTACKYHCDAVFVCHIFLL